MHSIAAASAVMFGSVVAMLAVCGPGQANPVVATGPRCTGQCLEAAVEARKEQIKRDLLDRLGLAAAPNISISRDMPHVLQETWPLWANGSMASDQPQALDPLQAITPEYRRATTERIISFARPGEDGLATFNYSRDDYQMYVSKATLRVYLRPLPGATDTKPLSLQLFVYGTDKNGQRRDRPIMDMKVDYLATEGRWVTVTGALQNSMNDWFSTQRVSRDPLRPFALHIQCEHPDHAGENLVEQPVDDQSEHTMYMSIEVSNERGTRDKRSAAHNVDCQADGADGACCRSKLRIEFAEFGWDWIIAPKYYDAYLCTGSCTAANTHSIHAHLTNQYNSQHERRHHGHHQAAASPCCHPTEYSKLGIIYMKQKDTVEVSYVEGMVAQRCGCA